MPWKVVILSRKPSNVEPLIESLLKNEPQLALKDIILVADGPVEQWEQMPNRPTLIYQGDKPFVFARNANIGIVGQNVAGGRQNFSKTQALVPRLFIAPASCREFAADHLLQTATSCCKPLIICRLLLRIGLGIRGLAVQAAYMMTDQRQAINCLDGSPRVMRLAPASVSGRSAESYLLSTACIQQPTGCAAGKASFFRLPTGGVGPQRPLALGRAIARKMKLSCKPSGSLLARCRSTFSPIWGGKSLAST